MAAQYGHKIKPERGAKVVARMAASKDAIPGEEVLLLIRCNNLRPLADYIAVTNIRLAGVSSGNISVAFSHIEPVDLICDPAKQTIKVTNPETAADMLFKMVHAEDQQLLEETLAHARSLPSPAPPHPPAPPAPPRPQTRAFPAIPVDAPQPKPATTVHNEAGLSPAGARPPSSDPADATDEQDPAVHRERFGRKITPRTGDKIISDMYASTRGFAAEEEVLLLVKCNNMRPSVDYIAVTDARLAGIQPSLREVKLAFPHSEPLTLTCDPAKQTVHVTNPETAADMMFKMVAAEDQPLLERTLEHARSLPAPRPGQSAAFADSRSREERAEDRSWRPHTKVIGNLSKKASLAVYRQCHTDEEYPWLILVSFGGGGLLAAFVDRLAIIKTGALTSLMAGSLGGERAATFHYSDITGIEYNSGFSNGVLEILTPSYNGTANRDYWRGSGRSRNADANDPYTLSNTLPLNKSEYKDALKEINELRSRISQAKQHAIQGPLPAPEAPSGAGLAQELRTLSELRDAGVLSEDEFAAAKRRLLNP